MTTPTGPHDVVVIGAGHNGLVAANYLAGAGLDVLVVEAAPEPGGQSTTSELITDAPGHFVNPCAVDFIFLQATGVVEDLELRRYGLRQVPADPSFCYLGPDGETLALWRDPRRTADEIRRFSTRDARAYLGFVRTLDAVLDVAVSIMIGNPCRPEPRAVARTLRNAVKHRSQGRDILGMMTASAAQVISERFQHDMVRGLLAQLTCAAIGPLTADGSGLAMITTGFLHRWGALRPVGGTGALVDALIFRLTEHGGTVRCSAPVEQIVVGSGGRASGVRLATGEQITARHGVIATCDPRTALRRLLPADTLDHATSTKVDFIPGCQAGVVPFKVDVAVGRHVTFPRHRRADGLDLRLPSLLTGSVAQLERACAASAAGQVPDDINLWISTPTAADPSQAPDGHDVLYLYVPVMPGDPAAQWSDLREDVGKRIVATAGEFLDGLDAEIGRYVEDPQTMSHRVHTTPGSQVFHVDFGLLRSGPLRPAFGLGGSRTPVPGLFLGGGGSHPGPGITGVPGRIAANEVLRDRKRKR